jgi:hypothetical protein
MQSHFLRLLYPGLRIIHILLFFCRTFRRVHDEHSFRFQTDFMHLVSTEVEVGFPNVPFLQFVKVSFELILILVLALQVH